MLLLYNSLSANPFSDLMLYRFYIHIFCNRINHVIGLTPQITCRVDVSSDLVVHYWDKRKYLIYIWGNKRGT